MASKTAKIRRQGRRVAPALARTAKKAVKAGTKVTVSLGELIAAAFDAAGSSGQVKSLLTSKSFTKLTGTRLVLV